MGSRGRGVVSLSLPGVGAGEVVRGDLPCSDSVARTGERGGTGDGGLAGWMASWAEAQHGGGGGFPYFCYIFVLPFDHFSFSL